jgi:hypothetical protein
MEFLFGVIVGVAGMVFKNRLTRIKNKVASVISEEMKQKP